jgi:hypothetical protein
MVDAVKRGQLNPSLAAKNPMHLKLRKLKLYWSGNPGSASYPHNEKVVRLFGRSREPKLIGEIIGADAVIPPLRTASGGMIPAAGIYWRSHHE